MSRAFPRTLDEKSTWPLTGTRGSLTPPLPELLWHRHGNLRSKSSLTASLRKDCHPRAPSCSCREFASPWKLKGHSAGFTDPLRVLGSRPPASSSFLFILHHGNWMRGCQGRFWVHRSLLGREGHAQGCRCGEILGSRRERPAVLVAGWRFLPWLGWHKPVVAALLCCGHGTWMQLVDSRGQ